MKTYHTFSMLPAIVGGFFTSYAVSSAQALYTSGHGDVGLGELSELEPHIHLESGAVVGGLALTEDTEFEPDELLIFVSDATRDYVTSLGGRPAGAAWDPIGVGAGESYWFLPESGLGAGGATALNTPFLGVGGEEITLGAFDGNVITFTLTDALLPAGAVFSLWNNGLAPSFSMSTLDGISTGDSILLDLDQSDHAHFNWGFTKAGLYELTFEVSALEGGNPVSATGTYSFLVSIPEPSSAGLLIGICALGFMVRYRRR